MNEKQAEARQTGREDQVRLKPVLGVRPGVYLAFIYSIILLLVLFFILIYPGIVRPGAVIMLKTEPAGAALRVDGVYQGTSPDGIFVSRGRHTLELVLPGFTVERLEREIPGRLFASALFPRRYPLEVKLSAPDPAAAFALAAADYAAWTFGGEPTAAWQIPLSLSEGAYRIGRVENTQAINELLKASARFALTRAALRDLVRAKTIADNGGLSPSPLSLVRSAADISGFLSVNPGGAAWLAETLPPESAALVIASAWYQKQLAAAAEMGANESLAPMTASASPVATMATMARQLSLDGLEFTGIAGGTLVHGEPFPYAVPVAGFMICNSEVPAATFSAFLGANPQWSAERREALAGEGMVTSDYLNGGDVSGRMDGLTAVSWYAAQAFCAWLSGRLPPSLDGFEIRLPTEAEWEYAAKSVRGWAAAEVKGMEDGAWEWCADPYAPLGFLADADAIAAAGSPERAVRGGSFLNPLGSINPETRASLPPAFCSPFVSFRPVIAPKK
jgi:formylglycine-generating enzyme required for sulfatase activity